MTRPRAAAPKRAPRHRPAGAISGVIELPEGRLHHEPTRLLQEQLAAQQDLVDDTAAADRPTGRRSLEAGPTKMWDRDRRSTPRGTRPAPPPLSARPPVPPHLSAPPPHLSAPPPTRRPAAAPPRHDGHSATVIQANPLATAALEARQTDENRNERAQQMAAATSASKTQGQLVVFFSTHGGTGTSTLAANAAASAARAGRSTCLVDLDLQLGDALTMLGLEPRCPMSQIGRDMESFDWEMLAPMLPRHASGVSVVSQVGNLEQLGELTVGRLPQLLRYLQEQFDLVVVDGVRDFNDHALATMDIADQLVLVVTQDVPSVRGVSRRLNIFRRLGYQAAKIKVVVNRFDRKNAINLAAISEAIGMSPAFAVLNDFPRVHRAITKGVLLSELEPGAPISGALEELARRLFELPQPAPRRAGLWSRVFRRR